MDGNRRGIVLARTRHNYDSYYDFWKLAELSNIHQCWVDQMDFSKEVLYVVTPMNGDVIEHLENKPSSGKKCRIAWWDLERHDAGFGNENKKFKDLVRHDVDNALKIVDYVWTSDRYVQSIDQRMIHVVMGSHPDFASGPPDSISKYDLCHMSYVCGRRKPIISALSSSLRIGLNGWGIERDATLRSCKSILNVHQTSAPVGEPLRFALAAAYGVPILTETLLDPWPLQDGIHLLMTDYGSLVKKVPEWLREGRLHEIGQNLFKKLAIETDFGKSVRESAERTWPL